MKYERRFCEGKQMTTWIVRYLDYSNGKNRNKDDFDFPILLETTDKQEYERFMKKNYIGLVELKDFSKIRKKYLNEPYKFPTVMVTQIVGQHTYLIEYGFKKYLK
jgi:hypothetical protein